ncbi:thiamine diphosphokinase [Roseovarius salis]|uniref:thiamine diphosphokinase n=1 Tax=Roseovarius salis TaxID=3376063 RepID=UPI0037C624A8
MIVNEREPVTLIGGAQVTYARLARARALAPHVAAADSGADAALAHGVAPKAVIGDFDSLSDAARRDLPPAALHPISEQDSTDFDKCLRNIAAPLVIGIGFSGDRLDHQLAAYNTLVRHPARRCILLGAEELVFVCPPSVSLPLGAGTAVSLFPMAAVEGVSDGLRWPIGGLNFAPDGRVGTSNLSTGTVHLSVTTPKMLVILPQSTLETVVAALLATTAAWPEA